MGVRYYKTSGTTITKIFVEAAKNWDGPGTPGISVMEYSPAQISGCSALSAGSTLQPRLRIDKVAGSPGSYWQASVDCGNGFQTLSLTLYDNSNTNYALGETEIYGYQASSSPSVVLWPSMSDAHISNLWRAPGDPTNYAWGTYYCASMFGSPPWKPQQAYAGYAIVTGSTSCYTNF